MVFKYRPRAPEALEKRTSASGSDFRGFFADQFKIYKIRKGDNFVRFLPPTWEDAEHYGMDLHIHYQVGPDRAQVLCPFKMRRQRCPLCEAQARAERANDAELAQELRAGKVVAAWIIDRKEEEAGPLLWAMPFGLDRDICKISKDPQTGEVYAIDHPTEGFDVSFEKEGEKLQTKYKGAQLARRASSISQDYLDWVELNPIPDTLVWRDYDQIKELYEGAAALTGLPEEPATPAPRARGTAPSATKTAGPMADDPILADEAALDEPLDKEAAPIPRPRTAMAPARAPATSGKTRAEELRERFARR